jgi:hypothetical protein
MQGLFVSVAVLPLTRDICIRACVQLGGSGSKRVLRCLSRSDEACSLLQPFDAAVGGAGGLVCALSCVGMSFVCVARARLAAGLAPGVGTEVANTGLLCVGGGPVDRRCLIAAHPAAGMPLPDAMTAEAVRVEVRAGGMVAFEVVVWDDEVHHRMLHEGEDVARTPTLEVRMVGWRGCAIRG